MLPEGFPVVGNAFGWREVYEWLSSFAFHNGSLLSISSCVCISGPPGIGKSEGIRWIAAHLGIQVTLLDSETYPGSKDLEEWMTKCTSCHLLDAIAHDGVRQKKLLWVDGVDALIGMDRGFVASFLKIVAAQKLPNMPVFVVGDVGTEKRFGGQPLGGMVRLGKVDVPDVYLLLRRTAPASTDPERLAGIAEACKGNVSYALRLLELDRKEDGGTQERMDDQLGAGSLYTDAHGRDELRRYLMEDPWQHPMRFHESLPKAIAQRKGVRLEKARVCRGILQTLCEWDMWMCRERDIDQVVIPTEHVISGITGWLPRLEHKKNATAVTGEAFSKMLSQLSLQKKTQRGSYDSSGMSDHATSFHMG